MPAGIKWMSEWVSHLIPATWNTGGPGDVCNLHFRIRLATLLCTLCKMPLTSCVSLLCETELSVDICTTTARPSTLVIRGYWDDCGFFKIKWSHSVALWRSLWRWNKKKLSKPACRVYFLWKLKTFTLLWCRALSWAVSIGAARRRCFINFLLCSILLLRPFPLLNLLFAFGATHSPLDKRSEEFSFGYQTAVTDRE